MDNMPPVLLSELPSPLEDHLGYWLRRVSNHVSGTFARALQAQYISVAEWVALRHIQSGQNMTPGELAKQLGMTRGAISKIIDKLECKQWILQSKNPGDNRVQWLTLTPQGEQRLPELAQIADANDKKFFGCLDADEQGTLRELLRKLTHVHQWDDVPID